MLTGDKHATAQSALIHSTLAVPIAAVQRVQRHTGLTHYFLYLTYFRFGTQDGMPEHQRDFRFNLFFSFSFSFPVIF